jgi:hypothetical protein
MLLILALAALTTDASERIEKTLPLAPNGRLALDGSIGEVRIRATNRQDVLVVARKHAKHGREERFAEMRVEFETKAGEVRIRSVIPQRNNDSLAISYDIEAPATARLDLNVGVGEVRVEGAANDVRIQGGVGEVEVRVADSFDPRRVRLETGVGDIDAGGGDRAQGWVGKKLSADYAGNRDLTVKVGVGEIRVRGGTAWRKRRPAATL